MNNDKNNRFSKISTKRQTGHRPDIDRTSNLIFKPGTKLVSGRLFCKAHKSLFYVRTGHHTNKELRTREKKTCY